MSKTKSFSLKRSSQRISKTWILTAAFEGCKCNFFSGVGEGLNFRGDNILKSSSLKSGYHSSKSGQECCGPCWNLLEWGYIRLSRACTHRTLPRKCHASSGVVIRSSYRLSTGFQCHCYCKWYDRSVPCEIGDRKAELWGLLLLYATTSKEQCEKYAQQRSNENYYSQTIFEITEPTCFSLTTAAGQPSESSAILHISHTPRSIGLTHT